MREHFCFYGYNPPTSGKYEIGGVTYFSGEDYRSVKRYKEYMNAGFDILLLQHENSYSGEDFAGSACKLCMDRAFGAGIKKIVVSDTRLKALCTEERLLGDCGRFKSERELCDYIDFCTAPYRNHPGFYGVQLFDEPHYKHLESYGRVCRALRKMFPDIYLQCNLFPVTGADYVSCAGKDLFTAYERYLEKFAQESGEKYLLFDEYPFLREYILGVYSLRTYQIAAEVCKRHNLELRAVMQSFSFFHTDHLIHRRVTERDMYWQMNMALGFGCREFAFFTYFTKQKVALLGGHKFDEEGKLPIAMTGAPSGDSVDGAAFINRDGSRTRLYYYTRRIISEFRKFEPVILKYRFRQSYLFFEDGKCEKDYMQTRNAIVYKGCGITVKPDFGVALVTELEAENSLLFMVENFSNVKEEYFDGKIMRAGIYLGGDAKEVTTYFRGNKKMQKVNGGRFTKTLRTGDAVFIEIKKA